MTITTDDQYKELCTESLVWVDYKNIVHVLDVDKKVYIDDGLISLIVKEMGKWGWGGSCFNNLLKTSS